jgi:thymidylate kinase
VREAYLARASREPQRLMVVDAGGSIDAVGLRIRALIAPLLEVGR